MKKKIAATLAVMVLTAGSLALAPTNNFVDSTLTKVSAAQNNDPKFSFSGVCLGMTLNEVKNILGEPVTQIENDEFVFSNGLVVEFNKRDNTAEKIKTRQNGVGTNAGVAVGMSAQKLSEIYGTADKVENEHGKTEYKYFGANGLFKIEFIVRGGVIESIEAEIRD